MKFTIVQQTLSKILIQMNVDLENWPETVFEIDRIYNENIWFEEIEDYLKKECKFAEYKITDLCNQMSNYEQLKTKKLSRWWLRRYLIREFGITTIQQRKMIDERIKSIVNDKQSLKQQIENVYKEIGGEIIISEFNAIYQKLYQNLIFSQLKSYFNEPVIPTSKAEIISENISEALKAIENMTSTQTSERPQESMEERQKTMEEEAKIIQHHIACLGLKQQKAEKQQTANNEMKQNMIVSDDLVEIRLETISQEMLQVNLSNKLSILEFKNYIYSEYCQQLEPKRMDLFYIKKEGMIEQIKLFNHEKLVDCGIISPNVKYHIRQAKCLLVEISRIGIVTDQIDFITEEQGVATMICGHQMGRDGMSAFIRFLIEGKKYQILCPHKNENNACLREWDFQICQRIGVFTQNERQTFQQGLSQNYIKKNTKECPNQDCKEAVFKGEEITNNRVRCPSCYSEDFCFLCLNQWNGDENCGNQDCGVMQVYLDQVPCDKIFELNEDGEQKEYHVPRSRICPHCQNLIEHNEGCKHMQCNYCQQSFCWVCLSVPTIAGWECKSAYDYCGKVAPTQKYSNK